MGYVVESGNVRPSETKTDAVMRFPEPGNVKQIQNFLVYPVISGSLFVVDHAAVVELIKKKYCVQF